MNGTRSKFVLCLFFFQYLLHRAGILSFIEMWQWALATRDELGMETVAVGARGLALPTADRDLLTLLLTTCHGSPLLGRVPRCHINVRGTNWMVDETAGDDGRNGTGGDRGNVALSNSTFRPTSNSRTHCIMYHVRVNVDISWIHH